MLPHHGLEERKKVESKQQWTAIVAASERLMAATGDADTDSRLERASCGATAVPIAWEVHKRTCPPCAEKKAPSPQRLSVGGVSGIDGASVRHRSAPSCLVQ